MGDELIQALEERVRRLIGAYRQLQADHASLQERVAQLEARQQLAVARIDGLLQKVQEQ